MRGPDHVWNRDLGAYDQIIALTQYMVNESFFNMWTKVRNSKDPNHPLLKFKTGSKRYGSIDADLDAPLVIFNVESAAFNEVVYVMRVRSGKGQFYLESEEDTTEVDLSGFNYAFKVEIGNPKPSRNRVELIDAGAINEPAGSPNHDQISGELPKAGGSGDYSVARLLIDFTRWDNKPNLRADFTSLMTRHLELVKQAEKTDPNAGSTLGFVATVNNPALS
ncbi:MAG: hypothetical protein Q9198_005222 [Flavoplaca austrocitrina]